MNRYMVYSTVIIAHELDADDADEAMEEAWLWANRQPPEWEVIDHAINFRRPVTA